MRDAVAEESGSPALLLKQRSDSVPGLESLIPALRELTEALIQQAEAISQLAMSNEALANAVTSQPEEGDEAESGYLS